MGFKETDAISYSRLKKVATRPIELVEEKDISNFPSVKQGKIFDMVIEGDNPFGDEYAYYDGTPPSETNTLGKLAVKVIDYCVSSKTEPTKELVLAVIQANDFWKSTKDETKMIANFDKDEFWNYVKFKIANADKTIIDKKIFDNVKEAKATLVSHPFSRQIFERRVIYQEEIYFDYTYEINGETRTTRCKIYPDVMSFDDENKIIYPFDFKFMSGMSAYKFPAKFFEMYYYIQASLYTIGIRQWAKEHYPDYRVFTYQFLVISDKDTSYPLIFDPTEYVPLGLIGFNQGYRDYPGINQLMVDYEWHVETQQWKHRRQIYDNNGKIKLLHMK